MHHSFKGGKELPPEIYSANTEGRFGQLAQNALETICFSLI
jgi:hypothetical protein